MFAGIIETTGVVGAFETDRTNRVFWIESPLAVELKVDQSVAHDGVCLTVEEIDGNRYRVSAIAETLAKTALGQWSAGRPVNIERCLAVGDRIDGHFVQGHVDTTGAVREIKDHQGSREIFIGYPAEFEELIVSKGSICVNGVSLTVVAQESTEHFFSVHIIPYTLDNTNLGNLNAGDPVNLEFDVLGKYIQKIMQGRLGST